MPEPRLKYYLSDKAKENGISFAPPRPLDGGWDIRCLDGAEIPPRSAGMIRTGLHLAVPEGWVALVRDRSSVAKRGGAVTAGVIDASYRGEVLVLLHNLGSEPLQFERGERIAQCLVVPCLTEGNQLDSLEALGETERGSGGFGSTGRN